LKPNEKKQVVDTNKKKGLCQFMTVSIKET